MQVTLESFDQITKNLDPHVVKLSRGAAYFGAGVLFGILVKKYLRLLLLSAIICFFTIKGLEYKHILNIDWGVMNEMFGLRPTTSLEELAMLLYHWSITNIYESISGAVGFVVGFKVA